MKHSKRPVLTGLLIGVTVLSVGCSPSPEEAGGQSVVPVSIDCRVFYRPSVTESLSESPISLTTNGDHEVIEFDDMEFNAQYRFIDAAAIQSFAYELDGISHRGL